MRPLNIVWLTTTVLRDCSHTCIHLSLDHLRWMFIPTVVSYDLLFIGCSTSAVNQTWANGCGEALSDSQTSSYRWKQLKCIKRLSSLSHFLSFCFYVFYLCMWIPLSLPGGIWPVHPFIHQSVEQHDLNALQSSSKYAYNHFKPYQIYIYRSKRAAVFNFLFLTPTCQSRKEVMLYLRFF